MKELLKRIFIVHKCVSCRKILDFKSFNNALCSDCREGYLGARMDICPECSLEAERCRCMTPLLKKDGALSLRKLFFYSKSKAREPQNRLIYYLKRHKSKRASFFVAGELLPLINEEMARHNINEMPLLVGVPRSRGAFLEYGFDQSDLLCRSLAERCGIEYCPVLKRRYGRAQKGLTAGERRKNIKNVIYLDKNSVEKIRGRYVILLDDVVTTGASMAACIDVLRECGVKGVLCVAIAKDEKI